MSEKSEKRPEDATRVAEWIAQQLKEGEATRLAKRERVTFHKLTREEYANTIRDLLGVRFDANDPTGLRRVPAGVAFGTLPRLIRLAINWYAPTVPYGSWRQRPRPT